MPIQSYVIAARVDFLEQGAVGKLGFSGGYPRAAKDKAGNAEQEAQTVALKPDRGAEATLGWLERHLKDRRQPGGACGEKM